MIKIEIQDIKQTVVIEGEEYLLLPKAKAEKLLADNFEQKADIEILRQTVTSILKILGILDEKTGTIREGVRNGSESYLKYMLKSLKNVVLLMGTAQFSKKAEAELAETFSFIAPLIPIIDKYAAKKP